MADTLFAVSFAVGDGGDGCAGTGMNRLSADARRLFDIGLSSPFGLQMRNQGYCAAQYDPTGRGALPAVTKREIWERVFIRVRKFPTSGSPDPVVWALKGTLEGSPALCLRINTSGTLGLYNQGNATAPGLLLGSAGVSLNVWYCVEVYARFNNATEVPPNPPYENNAFVSWRLNGMTISNTDRKEQNPQYGIDRRNQQAVQSQLGDTANAGKGLEIDYADWIADGSGWIGNARRVTALRPTGAGTHTGWAGGNADYRQQIDFPFPAGGTTQGVSTSVADATQSYAVESAASKGVSGTVHSARIAVYFATVGGPNINLVVRRNGSDSLYNVGTPPQGAWSTWRIATSGWSASDSIEVGVKNSSSPGGTTRIGACTLLVEHESVGPGVQGLDATVRVLQTTYTGNGTQQSVDLGAIDSNVATLVPSLVLVFPESGTSPGAWWWDSKVFASACNNALGASFELIAVPGKVHITGANASSNQNTLTYRLIACFDPAQRVLARGAVALTSGSDNRSVPLVNSAFTPEAVIVARESAPTNDSTKIFFRGTGHAGDQSVSLGVDMAAVSDAIQSVQAGSFQVGTLVNEATQDFGFIACRTTPVSAPRLIAFASYTGNGSNPRTISLGLDGGTPIFALVVPTNSGKRWTRFGSVAKQFNGATTGSANAITAFGADALTVGSDLNTTGITYSVLALAAGTNQVPTLDYVSFDSGWQLVRDDGSGAYDEPQWSPTREYPYLIAAGATLRIKKAQVTIPNHLTGVTYHIRGSGPNGISVPSTAASLVSGDLFEITNVDASSAFPSGVTAFYSTFDIVWEVSRDGGTSWQEAGISRNPFYVCLSDTGPNTAILYRTVVHLACSNAGATSESQAAAKTWDLFSTGSGPRNVKTWDTFTTLYYYEPGKTFDENPHIDCEGAPGSNPLLSAHRGQCSTWAQLLQDAWSVNGVVSEYTFALPTVGAAFFVQEWDALSTTRPFWFQSDIFDMIPPAPGVSPDPAPFGLYDDPEDRQNFLNKKGLKGQGTASEINGCPSQKVFGNHQFLKYNGVYYDPSYGVTYADAADFQSYLAGYGSQVGGSSKFRLQFYYYGSPPGIQLVARPVGTVTSGASTTVFTLGSGEGAGFIVNNPVEIRLAANAQSREFRTITGKSGDTITVDSALSSTPAAGDTMRRYC